MVAIVSITRESPEMLEKIVMRLRSGHEVRMSDADEKRSVTQLVGDPVRASPAVEVECVVVRSTSVSARENEGVGFMQILRM